MAAPASEVSMGAALCLKILVFFQASYIESAQNFFRHVTIFDREWGQKTSLAIYCYIEAAQNFFRHVTIFDREWGQKTSLAIYCYIEAAQNVSGT
jgi:uncharacterized protein YozE (UPF0346 family)